MASDALKFKPQPCPTCGAPRNLIAGDWLRARRLRAGLGLRDMARQLGYSAVYLSDIERDKRNCTPFIRKAYEAL